MNSLQRFMHEYRGLFGVLETKDCLRLVGETLQQAPRIARTRKLKVLDEAMSRDLTFHYRGRSVLFPIREIDRMLAGTNDSFTFGTVREMVANDVYLRAFKPDLRCNTVLDLGCNRGIFSLIASKVLDAHCVIGVEPNQKYEAVRRMMSEKNGTQPPRAYWKLVGSQAQEKADSQFVSLDTIVRENNIQQIDFAKIDIEGGEVDVFPETGWLDITQNIAMELHPHFVDVGPVERALVNSGFDMLVTDQFGTPCAFKDAMFVYASRNGSLLH